MIFLQGARNLKLRHCLLSLTREQKGLKKQEVEKVLAVVT